MGEGKVIRKKLWEIQQAKDIVKNDFFRVYPITAEKLYDEGWEVEKVEDRIVHVDAETGPRLALVLLGDLGRR